MTDLPLLIRVSGRDRPRLTRDLLRLLADAGSVLEDMEQLVVRERRTLDVLVDCEAEDFINDHLISMLGAPDFSNFGATRSRGRNLGVSELDTFSASTLWRSWCHCILVRNADKTGRSPIDIAPLHTAFGQGALQVGRICRVYG